MVTTWTARSKKNTNWTSDRQVYYEPVVLAYDDTIGNYLNWSSTVGDNILVQEANNSDWTQRTAPTTSWTARIKI